MLQPIYTTFDSVKVRLANKVQFQADPAGPVDGELPNDLLAQLISDAETQVEQDLRGRYAIPFRSNKTNTSTWADLPDHSRRAIRVAVDMAAVIMVLNTDFGRGTHISGDNYSESQQKAYTAYIKRLLGQDPESEGAEAHGKRFRFSPPLDEMLLATSNREADDGYRGRIINTDADPRGAEGYATEQVNNPSRSYVRRRGFGVV